MFCQHSWLSLPCPERGFCLGQLSFQGFHQDLVSRDQLCPLLSDRSLAGLLRKVELVPQLLPDPGPMGAHQSSSRNKPPRLQCGGDCHDEHPILFPSEPRGRAPCAVGRAMGGVPTLQTPHRQCAGTWLKTWREEEKAGPCSFQLLSQCCAEGRVKVTWSPPLGVWRVLERQSPVWPQSSCSTSTSSCPPPDCSAHVVLGGCQATSGPHRNPSC